MPLSLGAPPLQNDRLSTTRRFKQDWRITEAPCLIIQKRLHYPARVLHRNDTKYPCNRTHPIEKPNWLQLPPRRKLIQAYLWQMQDSMATPRENLTAGD